MFHFSKKVAIVTGGGTGVGRAICMELGKKGARVIVADPSIQKAAEVADSISAVKGSARAVQLELGQPEALHALVEAIRSTEGRVDFMFNSAGSFFDHPARMQSVDELRSLIDLNEWSVVYGTTAAYQVMIRQGFGHIINTSSAAPAPAKSAHFTNAGSIAGFAVSVFSTTLRGESANLGVRVSVICPRVATSAAKTVAPPLLAKAILKGVERNQAFIPVDAPALTVA